MAFQLFRDTKGHAVQGQAHAIDEIDFGILALAPIVAAGTRGDEQRRQQKLSAAHGKPNPLIINMVRARGLEPPHPCEYQSLNVS